MSDINFSLIKIEGLDKISEPINTLINKISNAIGATFQPSQILRLAKAEAEASIILTEAETRASEIRERAMNRMIGEEARKQKNIESITCQSLTYLRSDADANAVEDDWIVNFFEKCRNVSHGEMQNLWARLLAEEVNTPGSISKRTVNFMESMDRRDAEDFRILCRFSVAKWGPLIHEHGGIYEANGLTYSVLAHLESIGLIHLSTLAPFQRKFTQSTASFSYHGMTVRFRLEASGRSTVETGMASFTQVGQDLASLCKDEPIPIFIDYLLCRHKKYSPYIVSPTDRMES